MLMEDDDITATPSLVATGAPELTNPAALLDTPTAALDCWPVLWPLLSG